MASEQPTAMQGPPTGMMEQPTGMMGRPPAGMMEQPTGVMEPQRMMGGGHLYMQTNGIRNCIIHYFRSPDGKLIEAGRCLTGGPGTGGYNPLVYRDSTPNNFEGARSVIISPDGRFLFATNAGDNSVSSFAVGDQGRLTLLDAKRSGSIVSERFGTAKSLAFDGYTGTLYVLHSLGPDHLRLMSVDSDGGLTARPEHYTVNTPEKLDRVATTITLSPDNRYLLVGTTFDERAKANPDGSPILWVSHNGGPHLVASNAPDPDGLVVFPVTGHGALGEPMYQDGGGGSPWYPLFLNHRPNEFVIGYAVADGISLASLDTDGKVSTSPVVQVDTTRGRPTEICWLSISPDDRFVFATVFGYSYVSTFRIEGNVVSVAKDPACPSVPGDGSYRSLNGNISSGPSDNWLSPTGEYLYQIYGNASKLVGYAVQDDGGLEPITSVDIPYNSCQGLAGF